MSKIIRAEKGEPIWLYTYQMAFFTIRNKLNSFKGIALASLVQFSFELVQFIPEL